MRYSKEEIEKFRKLRDKAQELKDEILHIIHPNIEYMCHFLEYYPDFNSKHGRARIRACWNGATAAEDIVGMMSHVLKKLKDK